LEIEGQPPMTMHPQSQDSFFLRSINATVRFLWDENRRCKSLVFRQYGKKPYFYLISTSASISTGKLNGSSAMPTAERACAPRSAP